MMSAKDFHAIAEVVARAVASAGPYEDDPQHDGFADGIHDAAFTIADGIATYCAERNHRFDRDRFLDACNVDTILDPVV